MAFHLLWGLVLWFSISKLGLGISTDSVHLLFGGLNLSEGHALISFDGSPLLEWPPLYPVLLATLHSATGIDIFAAANLLQTAAFLGLSFCLSLLFLRIFPQNFILALAANILSDLGAVILTSFNMVGSDYVHLFLVVLLILLTGIYIEQKSPRTFVAMSAIGMLAMLQRYLGVAAIATAVVTVFFFSAGSTRQRLVRSFFLSLSALPAGIWLFITSRLIERRAAISFAENFNWFSKSILEWFLPDKSIKAHLPLYTILLWVLILALIVLLFVCSRRYRSFSPYSVPVFLFGLFYLLALFGSASVAYYNKLGGRFILPLYIPFVALCMVSGNGILEAASKSDSQAIRYAATVGIFGALALLAVLLLRVSVPLVLESHAEGAAGGENAFNTSEWRTNAALRFWTDHPPQGNYLLFSNNPDGVAFYSRHACLASPRRFSGPYGTEEFPVSQYATELFSSGLDVYIIWIEPNDYSYYYKVEDLSSIAQIEPIYISSSGGVYRLKPKTDKIQP